MDPQYQNFQNLTPSVTSRHSSGALSPKLLLIMGGLVAAILVAILLFALNSSNSPAEQMQRLSARLETLQTMLELGDKHVQNPELKKVQSDASILIKGNTATITAAMQTAGLEKIDKQIAGSEADTETLEKLNDARLNGRFDDAYATALAQKVESTLALMREVHDKTNSRALKAALSGAYDNQSAVLDELAKL